MTKWDSLLAQLDKVFGFEDRARSTVKKRWQAFDEKTNEHFFILESRMHPLRGIHGCAATDSMTGPVPQASR